MSTILCIDTASDRFALAVDRDGDVHSVEADAQHDHSRLLLPAIKELLGDEKPDAILVAIGPGAYAGVRVGIATAQGMALANGIDVYGIGTLEAAALATGLNDGVAIHPAGRGQFAVQRWEGGQAIGRPAVADVESLGAARIVGEGAGAFGGTEVSPRERVEAAVRARAPQIRSGALEPSSEAFYLREPNITVSRRQSATAS
ncbi:MAG: tRNA (adenosine(37)-N6)-threonylcarbamoyltransferase complex dimerization subunit type 1 TsaB [Dehalococcoidia bacterium]